MMRRRDYRWRWAVLAAFVATGLFAFLIGVTGAREEEVEAASLANFDAGYIISDYQMGNYTSMTEAEIQKFLTAKNSCPNRDEDYYKRLSASTKSATWHWADGHFVCLSEEKFGDGEVVGEGETAAHIIWQAAQDYKINPQVLIVLLEKETGLITDSIPNTADYRKATGYGCPDTAACSSKYYGFKNQVRNAAAMYRAVLNGGWTNYPLGKNYIQYNPDASCGGSQVEIKNLATSALYRYTPYQPNAAALSAGYGTALCGAYGNRNFYLYFQDWFGGIANDGPTMVEAKTEFKQTVEDGVYQLVLKSNTAKVADAVGGVYSGMSSADMMVYNNKLKSGDITNEVFEIKYNKTTGYYNIVNPTTKLVFDVKGGNVPEAKEIILWKANSGCNQDWLFEKDDSGYYTVISRCSSKVLATTSNNDLVIEAGAGTDSQKWQLAAVQMDNDRISDGIYQIVSDKNETFDISGGVTSGMTTGALVGYAQKAANDTKIDNQLFEVKFDEAVKAYRITNVLTGMTVSSGDKMVTDKNADGCAKQWVTVKQSNENYKIYSKCGGAVSISNEKLGGSYRLTTSGLANRGWKFVKYYEADLVKAEADYQLTIGSNAIDISGGIISGMTRGDLISYPAKTTNFNNQTFRFRYDKNSDSYFIYNPTTNLYLDVREARTEDNTMVILYKYNGNCNQRWRVQKGVDGYLISSACSGKNLTVSGLVKVGSYYSIVISNDGTEWKIKS